jgi:hypothetical protein
MPLLLDFLPAIFPFTINPFLCYVKRFLSAGAVLPVLLITRGEMNIKKEDHEFIQRFICVSRG